MITICAHGPILHEARSGDKLATVVDLNGYDILMEPSAGNGAFFSLLPASKRLGIDVNPKTDGITQEDFLTYARYAIRHSDAAATFAQMIAFIVPRKSASTTD